MLGTQGFVVVSLTKALSWKLIKVIATPMPTIPAIAINKMYVFMSSLASFEERWCDS